MPLQYALIYAALAEVASAYSLPRAWSWLPVDQNCLVLSSRAATFQHLMERFPAEDLAASGVAERVDEGLVISSKLTAEEDLVRDGVLRADLLDRIGVRRIQIPSLAERKEDIVCFVKKKCIDEGYTLGIRFYAALLRYDWPGNVRELLKVLDLAVDRCVKQDRRLKAASLDLRESPMILPTVEKMEAEDADREVYQSLAKALTQQGLRKQTGLLRRMADSLRDAFSTVTKKARRHLSNMI